jgi:hypothetical protein
MVGMKIKVRQWLTKPGDFHDKFNNGKPLPMRTMVGRIVKESARMYYIEVHGRPEPSSTCLHCGRRLTHPVSLLYGIGPVCGQHFHISPIGEDELDRYMEEIRSKLAEVKWSGWVPKAHVTIEYEKAYVVTFKYNGTPYRTVTTDPEKVQKIKGKATDVQVTETLQ